MRYERRRLLQFGVVSLGGPWLGGRPVDAARRRARACILLFMDGGPSHIDLWDRKPDAPLEIRGPLGEISTTVPGIHDCEQLPRVARQMHRVVQIRSVRHEEMVHDPAVYVLPAGAAAGLWSDAVCGVECV